MIRDRRRYIGSGDIAAIAAGAVPEWAHMARWKNQADVFARLVFGLDIPMRTGMKRGLQEEQAKRELFRATVGPMGDETFCHHPTLEWAAASPDGLAEPDGIGEIKTWSSYAKNGRWGEPGSDLVPDSMSLQGQWLMECADRNWVVYLVDFGRDIPQRDGGGWVSDETAVYRIWRDRELAKRLIDIAHDFWTKHVCPRVPPAMQPVHNKRAYRKLVANE